jgi:PhnB protein
MQVTTHLNFSGNCEAAFQFYAETLGGKITMMMTQGESPMGDTVPTEMKGKIMHASLEMPGGANLMGADHPQEKRCSLRAFAYQFR